MHAQDPNAHRVAAVNSPDSETLVNNPVTNHPETELTLRIAQLNILNHTNGENARYELLQKHLERIQTDIITLQEVGNPEKLAAYLKEVGYTHVAFTSKREHHNDAVGIASRHPFTRTQPIQYWQIQEDLPDGMLAEIHTEELGHLWVYSGHFGWNMKNEHVRQAQAKEVARLARELTTPNGDYPGDTIFLVGADLNASETSDTYRYLTGQTSLDYGESRLNPSSNIPLDLHPALTLTPESTFFVDAYEMADSKTGWATTGPYRNDWVQKTAERHGTRRPELMPERRIDYIFSYEWVYGKRGCPLNYGRFGEMDANKDFFLDLSDHYGIYTDILL